MELHLRVLDLGLKIGQLLRHVVVLELALDGLGLGGHHDAQRPQPLVQVRLLLGQPPVLLLQLGVVPFCRRFSLL